MNFHTRFWFQKAYLENRAFDTGGSYFYIDYILEARLHRSGFMTWDVKNSHEVFLNDEPFPYNNKTPVYYQPTTKKVNFCCCFASGSVTLGVKLDSSNITASDELRVDYEVSNNSTSRVKALEVQVNEIISFRAQGRTAYHTIQLFQTRIESEDLLRSGLNIGPRKVNQGMTTEEYNDLAAALTTGIHGTNLRLLGGSHSDYNGRLGSIRHVVKVAVKTPFCVDDPEVEVPLSVYGSRNNYSGLAPVVAESYSLPSDWNPVVAQVAYIDLSPSAPPQEPVLASLIKVPTAPPIQVDGGEGSLKQLLEFLGNTSERGQTGVLVEWMSYGDLSQLQDPQSFAAIFKSVKGSMGFSSFPSILGNKLPSGSISCRHVAAAISTINTECIKVNVATAFSSYVGDRHNAKSEFSKVSQMSGYSLSCILISYNDASSPNQK